MTKKDYELIAKSINLTLLDMATGISRESMDIVITTGSKMANDLSDALQADNPRFDRQRFLAACGV